jgi:hypothetical protein
MDMEGQSKQGLLLIEIAGLSITALLLLAIASCLQLTIRLLTNGALEPELGTLAFGFLFYVCALFLAVGTRQRPDQPTSLLANTGLAFAFFSAAWLLLRSAVAQSWFALALLLVALVHCSTFGFALLRRRRLDQLVRHATLLSRGPARFDSAAVQDAFLERFFLPRSQAYLALPIGAAFGAWLGARVDTPAETIVPYAAAGACAAIAAGELRQLLGGVGLLVRTLTVSQHEERVLLDVVGSLRGFPLRVLAPEPSASNAELGVAAARITGDLRNVLLVNQQERMIRFGLASLALWQLSLPSLPGWVITVGLLAVSLLLTQVPTWLGQQRSNRRVLLPLAGPLRRETRRLLSQRPPAMPTLGS